jgi:hypothetical protein
LYFPIISEIGEWNDQGKDRETTTHGVTLTPGTRFMMNSAATMAFGLPTSFCLPHLSARILLLGRDDAPEEKLSIQITDVYGVHVNDMNVSEAR